MIDKTVKDKNSYTADQEKSRVYSLKQLEKGLINHVDVLVALSCRVRCQYILFIEQETKYLSINLKKNII